MEQHPLMTSSEVAALFRVDMKTVARWCRTGLLEAIRMTERGDYRIKRSSVEAVLNGTVKGGE